MTLFPSLDSTAFPFSLRPAPSFCLIHRPFGSEDHVTVRLHSTQHYLVKENGSCAPRNIKTLKNNQKMELTVVEVFQPSCVL